MAQLVIDYIRVLGPVHVPRLSVVAQVNLVMWSILRAMLFVSPQFNFGFTIAMFIETCLVDILVVAIGVCTTIVCTLAYYSFVIFLWCMKGIVDGVGSRQFFVLVRRCSVWQWLSIFCVLVIMVPDSLWYTYWHFNFVRQTWLHKFFVVIQALHVLPTVLMIFATIAQGMFLVGVIISTNPLRSIALAHGNKVRKHVYAFAGLNISLLLYSASAIFIACRQGLKVSMIVVWSIEVMFRLLSVAVAGYIEKNIGDENQLPPNRAIGGAEPTAGEVDDHELGDARNEASHQNEVASEETPAVELESQDQRVHVPALIPLQIIEEPLNVEAEQSSELFNPVSNGECTIPTSIMPFLSPYGTDVCIPVSRVAQESDKDSVPSYLVILDQTIPFSPKAVNQETL